MAGHSVALLDIRKSDCEVLARSNDFVMSGSVLKFAKLSDKAFAPIKGSEYAAGYDLRRYIIPKLLSLDFSVTLLCYSSETRE